MPSLPSPAAPNRPASFDRMLLDHMDALRRVVARLTKHNRADVVSEVVMDILNNWQKFDADKAGFYTWMVWRVRAVLSEHRRRNSKIWKHESAADLPVIAVPPAQPDHAQLSAVLAHLSGIKNGDVLIRRAMGDTLMQIANDRGCSQERVRQVEKEARAKLRRRAA